MTVIILAYTSLLYGFIISISELLLYLALYFLCVLVYIYEAGTKSV